MGGGGCGNEGNPPGGETSLKVNTSSRSAAWPGLGPLVFAPPPRHPAAWGQGAPQDTSPHSPRFHQRVSRPGEDTASGGRLLFQGRTKQPRSTFTS